MGTGIGRIEREFILENLNDKKIPVDIHGYKKTDHGLILRFSEKDIVIMKENASWDHFVLDEEVKVFFSYFGQVMTFSGKVKESGEYLTISTPSNMYKNLQRKYERVNIPGNIKVSFVFEDAKFELEFPRTEEYYDPEKDEKSYENAPIEILLSELKRQADKIGTTHTIKMFREKKPDCFEEEIVTVTGKILYLPSVGEGYPLVDPDIDNRILTHDMLLSSDYNAMISHKMLNDDDLRQLIQQKRKAGIYSEFLCPIVYLDYIIGVIHIVGTSYSEIPRGFIDYVYQFAKVLVATLKTNGYFSAEGLKERKYEAEVLDISASGLLFAHPRGSLAERIILYTDLDISLRLRDRRITVPSRVMRKYVAQQQIFFGVQFMDMKPEDFRFLFETIYGRDFSSRDEDLWEGGAPPPELSL